MVELTVHRSMPQSLVDLAASIKKRHAAITGGSMSIVQMAIDQGKDLLKAKAQVGHGGFLKWVAHHYQITEKTAERYMKFAANEDNLKAAMQGKIETISNLTLATAERLIDGDSTPPVPKTKLDRFEAASEKLEHPERQAFVETKFNELAFVMKELEPKSKAAA
jgi:Protein of unknown function (DUF3102)